MLDADRDDCLYVLLPDDDDCGLQTLLLVSACDEFDDEWCVPDDFDECFFFVVGADDFVVAAAADVDVDIAADDADDCGCICDCWFVLPAAGLLTDNVCALNISDEWLCG